MTADAHAARDRLIVALDVPTTANARQIVATLGDAVSFYKIGLELVFAGGLDLARELKLNGKKIFLDVKLLDIGNTVERAVATASALGADFLTVHGHDTKTLAAAVRGRGSAPTKLLGVTVLTSLDQSDLTEQTSNLPPAGLVAHRASLAAAAGFDGVIASGLEAASVRAIAAKPFLIVTPGIRPAGSESRDQARVTSPAEAISAGATHLVVGRPITEAHDPASAAQAILAEIAAALRA